MADANIAHAQALTAAELRELSFETTNAFFEARFADLELQLAAARAQHRCRSALDQ